VSEERVRQFLKEMRAVEGARYGWHYQRPGNTALPAKEPMYVRGKYPAEYVKSHGVNCTGLGNQALGRRGFPSPRSATTFGGRAGPPSGSTP
jgi:hypothetical protein